MVQLNPGIHRTTSKSSHQVSWWAKLVAILAVINYLLVLFDISYIPWRDLYLREVPSIVAFYDPFKGIEPHRVTEKYLKTVDELEQQLHQVEPPVDRVNLLLESLRNQSVTMIDENPFSVASKLGTFAKIKKRIRQHLNTESSKEAFKKFWSSEYLASNGLDAELDFFDKQIRPLFQSNYFRHVDDNGHFVDKFWWFDIWFTVIFGIDFLTRSFLISTQHPGINWLDAMLRRWYDVLLILPFWRWLRIVPVTVRLHQARLVNLERVFVHITYGPVAYIADKVSKIIAVRFINNVQDAIQKGKVTNFILKPRKYLTVNNINEEQVIIDRLLQLLIYKVLPQVQPDVEVLLHHSIEVAFKESSVYQNFQKLPVLGNMPIQATEQLVNNLAQTAVKVLTSSYSDTKSREIFYRLREDFNAALSRELQNEHTLSEIQSLLSDWLEEVKLNYFQGLADIDPQVTLAEVEELQEKIGRN